MKKCFIKVLIACLLLVQPLVENAGAWHKYDTISPINLTIGYWNDNPTQVQKDAIHESLRHAAVAVYEMTRGAHRLGKIRVIQAPREHLQIRWAKSWTEAPDYDPKTEILIPNNKAKAFAFRNTYIPFGQHSRWIGGVRIGDNWISSRNVPNEGLIHTGYTLAHEFGHFIYGVADEYSFGTFGGLAVPPAIMSDQTGPL